MKIVLDSSSQRSPMSLELRPLKSALGIGARGQIELTVVDSDGSSMIIDVNAEQLLTAVKTMAEFAMSGSV